jgi:hypothetical protein
MRRLLERERMSTWQTETAERNRKSFARLSRSLPAAFPPAVLARALDRPFIPPTPRLAIESYWRAHPLRAHRLARALAAKTGAPVGWTWRISQSRKTGLPATFRIPPAPYRERATAWVQAFAASAVSRFTGSAGTKICGAPGRTKTRSGTASASSLGNSGMRRIARQHSCVAFKGGAAAKQAGGSGKMLRSITASHCFEYGRNTGTSPGRSYSPTGACQTFR